VTARPWRWLALVPATAVLLAPFVANRVEPRVFGLPFLLAFITGWVLATSAVMALIFVLDERADRREGRTP
jgi:4-hydroxybenzoate polyprenyltransferase